MSKIRPTLILFMLNTKWTHGNGKNRADSGVIWVYAGIKVSLKVWILSYIYAFVKKNWIMKGVPFAQTTLKHMLVYIYIYTVKISI